LADELKAVFGYSAGIRVAGPRTGISDDDGEGEEKSVEDGGDTDGYHLW
jgi:hypothetical protein